MVNNERSGFKALVAPIFAKCLIELNEKDRHQTLMDAAAK